MRSQINICRCRPLFHTENFRPHVLTILPKCAILFIHQHFKGVLLWQPKKNSNLISSLLYLVIGILLVAFPGDALNWAMTIGGANFVISGVIDLLRKNYAGGAVSLIIGLVILLGGWLFIDIVLLVLGILIAVKGVVALLEALRPKKKSLLAILFAILTVLVGLFIAFGQALSTLLMIGGILMIIDGVLGLIGSLKK